MLKSMGRRKETEMVVARIMSRTVAVVACSTPTSHLCIFTIHTHTQKEVDKKNGPNGFKNFRNVKYGNLISNS